MSETARSNRYHIAVFGCRNAGKSSLVNSLVGQDVSIVSPVAGTTTDTVWKNIELPGIGAAVIADTAGFDDDGELGGKVDVDQKIENANKVMVTNEVGEVTPSNVITLGDCKCYSENDDNGESSFVIEFGSKGE